MSKAPTRAITSKRDPHRARALASLNAQPEEKKWTLDRLLFEMLARFFSWYDGPERGEAW